MKRSKIPLHLKVLETLENQSPAFKNACQSEEFQDFLTEISTLFSEVELDRDLLEKSLKLASDEMQDHFSQLAQASKMASLGEMAGNIAHEINNPLQILLMNCQTINNEIRKANFSVEDLEKKVKSIEQNANRIAKITKGLKSISRDSSKDEFVETDLQEVISELLSFCKTKIIKSGVDLIIPAEIPKIKFLSRPAQISQVLLNLVNNAFYAVYQVEDGRPKWISLQIQDSPQDIEMQISDSGNGVPDEFAKKIMEPFFTTKPVGEGTGLGLSVSAAIAKDHGGYLILNRDISKSCFVFKIAVNPVNPIALKKAA